MSEIEKINNLNNESIKCMSYYLQKIQETEERILSDMTKGYINTGMFQDTFGKEEEIRNGILTLINDNHLENSSHQSSNKSLQKITYVSNKSEFSHENILWQIHLLSECVNKEQMIEILYQTYKQTISNMKERIQRPTEHYNKKIGSIFAKFKALYNSIFVKILDKIKTNIVKYINEIIEAYILEISNPSKSHKANIKTQISELIEKFKESNNIWNIYDFFIRNLLKDIQGKINNTDNIYKIIINDITLYNEDIKNFIIARKKYTQESQHAKTASSKQISNSFKSCCKVNPWLKNYSLVPISNVLNISDISLLVFDKKSTNIQSLKKICATNKVDLIIITKLFSRPISYNILDLLDYMKSKDFEQLFKQSDGITPSFIKRMEVIQYMSKKNNPFKINYIYELENDNFEDVLIVEDLGNDNFHLLGIHDVYLEKYTINKLIVSAFLEFVRGFKSKNIQNTKSQTLTRVTNYNNILNSKIEENMFLGSLPDIEAIKQRAENFIQMESTNLNYTIIKNIMKEYEKISKKIKKISDFSDIIYDTRLSDAFIDTVILTYIEYTKKSPQIKKFIVNNATDIYTSFISILSNYERDFARHMHDNFMKKLKELKDPEFFTRSQNIIDKDLDKIFKEIITKTLESIITPTTDIFSSINYKLQIMMVV